MTHKDMLLLSVDLKLPWGTITLGSGCAFPENTSVEERKVMLPDMVKDALRQIQLHFDAYNSK